MVFFAVVDGQFWLIVSPTTDVYNRLVVMPAAERIAGRVRETRYVLELIGKENVTSRGLGKYLSIFVNDVRFAGRKRFASCPLLSLCLYVLFSPPSSLTDSLL